MCSQVYHGETAAPLELFEQIALRIAKSNLGETTRRFSTLHRASGTPTQRRQLTTCSKSWRSTVFRTGG